MSNWLLIVVLTSGLWGEGMPVTTVTTHDFPTKELCVSAANRIEVVSAFSERTFSYDCLRQEAGKWVQEK